MAFSLNFYFNQFYSHLKTNTYLFIDISLMTLHSLAMTLTIFTNSLFNELEWICIGIATNYLGLNVGLLNDLLLNSILCNLPLHILLVPWQLTMMQ